MRRRAGGGRTRRRSETRRRPDRPEDAGDSTAPRPRCAARENLDVAVVVLVGTSRRAGGTCHGGGGACVLAKNLDGSLVVAAVRAARRARAGLCRRGPCEDETVRLRRRAARPRDDRPPTGGLRWARRITSAFRVARSMRAVPCRTTRGPRRRSGGRLGRVPPAPRGPADASMTTAWWICTTSSRLTPLSRARRPSS